MSARYTRIWLLCYGGKVSFASATEEGAMLEKDIGEYVVPLDVPASALREPADAKREREEYERRTGERGRR